LGRDAVKIALVTAKGESSELAAGRRANAEACITKPFSPIKFLQNVDWLLV
jgi:DNA-binding response OmpR family regulator